RSGAAIGEKGEVARVDAAANGDGADGVGHAGVDDVENALRHRLGGKTELLGDAGNRLAGETEIEAHAAAGKIGRVDAAEDGVGVGHRRLGAAAAVARRAGSGARAL